jgi:hypothetical protein
MMILQGVDASFTILTDEAAKRLRAAGIQVFAQALWTGATQPAPRVTNLRVAQQNDFILLGYISVNGGVAGQYHAKMGRQGVPQDLWDALALAPIDVELDGIPNSTIRGALDAVYALGKRPSIYTSESCWLEKQGDSHDFGDTLLWDARWTGIPGPHPVTYGKWAGVVGYQYTGGQTLEGVYVDRDTFIKELLLPEETMSDEDKKKLILMTAAVNLARLCLSGDWQAVANALASVGVRAQ